MNVGLRCIFTVILSPNQHICYLKPVHILKFRFQLAAVRDQRWVRVDSHELTLIMIRSACMMRRTCERGGRSRAIEGARPLQVFTGEG